MIVRSRFSKLRSLECSKRFVGLQANRSGSPITPASRNDESASPSRANSAASTSSVCSPSRGGRVMGTSDADMRGANPSMGTSPCTGRSRWWTKPREVRCLSWWSSAVSRQAAQGTPAARDRLHGLVLGPLPGPVADLRVQRLAVLHALTCGFEAWVDQEVAAVHRGTQAVPMALIDGHQVDVVVRAERLARVDVDRRQPAGVAGPGRRARSPGRSDESPGAYVVGHRLLHGQLDLLPLAGAQLLHVGRENRHGGLHAGTRVAGGGAGHHGRTIGFAGDREGAGRGLRDHVHAAEIGVRSTGAKAFDARVDQAGVGAAQDVVADVQPLDDAGAVVLHEDVEIRCHAEQQVAAFVGAQVERHAALIGIPGAEVRRVVLVRGAADAAAGVAVLGRFDLDDVGTEPGEGLGARGPRLVLGHVEHPHAVQCRHAPSPLLQLREEHTPTGPR